MTGVPTDKLGGLRSVPFTAVEFQDKFWAPRLAALRARTVPILFKRCVDAGMIESLDVDSPPPPLSIPIAHWGGTTQMFWDSDLGKWIEAASYTLAVERDAKLEAQIDDIAERYKKAQRPDGYLNTYFIRRAPDKRWTNLRDWHELYCAGHMIEGAVAYFEATGKRALLDVMCRYVDHIAATLGAEPGQKRGYCGHEEIELALVKLYRATGNAKHLELARYFVDERGRRPHYFDLEAKERGDAPESYAFKTYEYSQSHLPVREQDKVTGHAVRAMYLYCAMADLAGETGDDALKRACERLWGHLTSHGLYLTGGMGPSKANEGFTADFDLPNETAYAETCAAVGFVFWAHRMLHLDCDGRYADMMELALYNGAVSGLSLSGDRFFYDNPLASKGGHHRWEWHECPCCPPNISRLVASLGRYMCSTGPGAVALHLYAASTIHAKCDGRDVTLKIATNYPWDGAITVRVDPAAPAQFALRLRIPGWCRDAGVSVNGKRVADRTNAIAGYVSIVRQWKAGDTVQLDLAMPVERVYANPRVAEDAGRVALKRGPLVYCLEAVDNAEPLHRITVPREAKFTARFEPDLLGGISVVTGAGVADDIGDWDNTLYRSTTPTAVPCAIKAVPYYAWDHRAPGAMQVWLREA